MANRKPNRRPSMDYLKARVEQIRSSISNNREELVQANREKIVDAATSLFKKRGFHRTVTRDIAQAIGVSQGHIYQYISRKEDILILMLDAAVDDYKKKLFVIADVDADAVTKLTAAIDAYYRILDEHHDKTTVLYNQLSHLEIGDRKIFDNVEVEVTELFKQILDEGVASGLFSDIDTFVVAYNIVSLGHMWALKRNRFKGYMRIDEYIDVQCSYVLKVVQGTMSAASLNSVSKAVRSPGSTVADSP